MEKWELALADAKKEIQLADHIMNITYKVINDPKLLLAVLDKVNNSLVSMMRFVLLFERYYKKIPPFHDSFEAMYNVFRTRIMTSYRIDSSYPKLIQEVNEIIRHRKDSPIEFRRREKLVICSDDFGMKILTEEKIKEYISKSKSFVKDMETLMQP